MNINNQEIERKFLVTSDEYRRLATESVRIRQGYLSTNEFSTIRVRTWGTRAFLTIKSRGKEGSCAHFEWEKEISLADAEALFPLVMTGFIEKTRYIVPLPSPTTDGGEVSGSNHGLVAEIDEFHGENEGLIIAEIELQTEDQTFVRPSFLGEEVTFDKRYRNTYISTHPFTTW